MPASKRGQRYRAELRHLSDFQRQRPDPARDYSRQCHADRGSGSLERRRSWTWSGTVQPAWCSHRTLKPTPNASSPKTAEGRPSFYAPLGAGGAGGATAASCSGVVAGR
jgi:hypothetical protein